MRGKLLVGVILLAAACKDPIGPGRNRGLPVTAIAVDGALFTTKGPLPASTVRFRFLDAQGAPARDTVAGCIGLQLRDTTISPDNGGRFRTLLIAGFPAFDGCLDITATPSTAGAFPVTIVSYPHLTLRDTSLHDTLHISIHIP